MPTVTETLAPIGVWDNLKPSFGFSELSNRSAGLQLLHSSIPDLLLAQPTSTAAKFASTCSGASSTAMNNNNNPSLPLGNIQLPGTASSSAAFNPEDLNWAAAFTQMNSGNKDSQWNPAAIMPQLQQQQQSALPPGPNAAFFQYAAANMPPRFHQRMANPSQVSHFGGNAAREDAGQIFSPEEAAELLSPAPAPLYRRHKSDTAATGAGQYHRASAHQPYDLPRRRRSDSSVIFPGVYGNAANFASFTSPFPEFTPEFGSHVGGLGGFPGAPAGDVSPRQRKRRTTDSGQGGVLCCQIGDCLADLTDEKPYCRRYKLCRKCMNRNSLMVGGREMRFCQQCSFLHHLSDFDGQKRSCRDKLQKHALRVRKSRAAAAAAQAEHTSK